MHYVTLATVEIPHIKEEEELNAIIAVAANTLEAQDGSDYMKEYHTPTEVLGEKAVIGGIAVPG